MLNQLKTAFITLTRLPFLNIQDDDFDLKNSLWAFPIVGLVLGLLLAFLTSWFISINMDSFIGSGILIILLILVTGALHEDGLADSVDALGATDKDRRMQIMRDSQIGTYGTLALIVSFSMRVYAVSFIWEYGQIFSTLVISLMVSRGAMVFIPIFCQPARDNGMASAIKNIDIKQLLIGQLIIGIIGFFIIGSDVIYLMLTGFVVAFLVARIAIHKIGGFTGDILGATEQITQISCFVIFHLLF